MVRGLCGHCSDPNYVCILGLCQYDSQVTHKNNVSHSTVPRELPILKVPISNGPTATPTKSVAVRLGGPMSMSGRGWMGERFYPHHHAVNGRFYRLQTKLHKSQQEPTLPHARSSY